MAFLPESPTWLSGTNRDRRATRAKKWLKLDRHLAQAPEETLLKTNQQTVNIVQRYRHFSIKMFNVLI